MIFCNLNDIELYLTQLNINNDQTEQEVNDYPIHKILLLENEYNSLVKKFYDTWDQCLNFWTILSKEELDKEKLELSFEKITNKTQEFNKIYLNVSTISSRHVRSLQVKAAFESIIYNQKAALEFNKIAFDIVKTRIKIRRYNRWGN